MKCTKEEYATLEVFEGCEINDNTIKELEDSLSPAILTLLKSKKGKNMDALLVMIESDVDTVCHRCNGTGWIEAHIDHGMYEWTRCPECQPQVGG